MRTPPDATHWAHPDEPVSRYGWTTAICGVRVNVRHGDTDEQSPTCERCQRWLTERNAPREMTLDEVAAYIRQRLDATPEDK